MLNPDLSPLERDSMLPGRARLTPNPDLSPNGGYVVESEDGDGFTLEVFYKSYSFFPNPDASIQEAKDYFVQVAKAMAGIFNLLQNHSYLLIPIGIPWMDIMRYTFRDM